MYLVWIKWQISRQLGSQITDHTVVYVTMPWDISVMITYQILDNTYVVAKYKCRHKMSIGIPNSVTELLRNDDISTKACLTNRIQNDCSFL